MIAGLVGCYRGLTVSGGGPKGVGTAVNETLVLCRGIALFAVNVMHDHHRRSRFGTGAG